MPRMKWSTEVISYATWFSDVHAAWLKAMQWWSALQRRNAIWCSDQSETRMPEDAGVERDGGVDVVVLSTTWVTPTGMAASRLLGVTACVGREFDEPALGVGEAAVRSRRRPGERGGSGTRDAASAGDAGGLVDLGGGGARRR